MIFVTVGTHTQGFERLVKAVDDLVGSGRIKEKVIMQIGNTKYSPKNCEAFRFESLDKMVQWNKKARIVVAHSGEGSIILALSLDKPIIVVPRYKKFGEHTDDHQLDLGAMIEGEKMGIAVFEISKLHEAIKNARQQKIAKRRNEQIALISSLRKYLDSMH